MTDAFIYALFTLAMLALFYCATQWTLQNKKQSDLDEASMLPFADEALAAQTARQQRDCRCPADACKCDRSSSFSA